MSYIFVFVFQNCSQRFFGISKSLTSLTLIQFLLLNKMRMLNFFHIAVALVFDNLCTVPPRLLIKLTTVATT